MGTTTESLSLVNISTPGVRQTRWRMPPILDVDAVQTATALLRRLPTSRSLAARRQGGRGLICASVCNTPTTTSSMETRSTPTTTTHYLVIYGSRCNPRGMPAGTVLRPKPVLRLALQYHERW